MIYLYAAGAWLSLVGVLVWIAYRMGRRAEQDAASRESARIKDEQLKVDRPSRDDVLGSLHDHRF